ncbi:MAG: DUF1194 domain-containing protein [Alphaproteobacteria bacterium]|nr:DUF1194 domain-containing protein [Alphaproteobacteria bacterium]
MGRCLSALPLLLAGFAVPAAAAADAPVDLELVLAVDVSLSIDVREAGLQREGYIRAFRDAEVIRAIQSGILGRIAVTYVEWAGRHQRRVVVGWTQINSRESAEAFAGALQSSAPGSARRTSISGAIDYALPLFTVNGFEGTRRVIDVSGDGPNNAGGLVTGARDQAVTAGVTVNGLPILDDSGGMYSWYNIPNLDLYYRDCVIGGPGAFMVVAKDFRDFARAVRRKLILEIAGQTPRLTVAQFSRDERASPPCDIGERLRQAREEEDF